MADVFGLPTTRATGGAALGAAMCAAAGVGLYRDIPEAVVAMRAPVTDRALPDAARTAVYRTFAASFFDRVGDSTDRLLRNAHSAGATGSLSELVTTSIQPE
jgi:sugar (pentulose or hexulose) kinase